MRIEAWMESRDKAGTLANVARRVLESDVKYRDVERTLQSMYVLEAMIRSGGRQRKAAETIGVSAMTVKRVLRGMSIKAADVRKIAERMRGRDDADTQRP
jgi:DNA-binding NtrC family response regulator